MENNLQTQKAGDGAQQTQFKDCVFNMGLSETQVDERAVSVFNELIPKALEAYTQDAYTTANQRIGKLENIVMPRLAQIDGALEHFADPAFQIVLRKAQQSVAATEREEDYGMLSELLACHVQKGENRKKRAAIHKAIEIVDQVDNDALCALTVKLAVTFWIPNSVNCQKGLAILSNLFDSLIYSELPEGSEWIEHLEILDAVRISSYSSMKKMMDIQKESLNGYVCAGIKKGSAEYEQAEKLLREIGFVPTSWLIDNELLTGYVRLPLTDKSAIDQMLANFNGGTRPLTQQEQETMTAIWNLYSTDAETLNIVYNSFEEEWDSHPSLKKLKIWWDALPVVFSITQIGKVLAHTNAKRCNSLVPDLI